MTLPPPKNRHKQSKVDPPPSSPATVQPLHYLSYLLPSYLLAPGRAVIDPQRWRALDYR